MKSYTEMQGDGFRDRVVDRWNEVITFNALGTWFSGVAMFCPANIAEEMYLLADMSRIIVLWKYQNERRESENDPGEFTDLRGETDKGGNSGDVEKGDLQEDTDGDVS